MSTRVARTARCQDCSSPIHENATHTGHEKWCEYCFDKGLTKDMDEHFEKFVRDEMEAVDDGSDEHVEEYI